VLKLELPLDTPPFEIRIFPDGYTTLISAGSEVRPVRAAVETVYARAKGRKVLNRIETTLGRLSIQTDASLLRFDTILALDTNTRLIGENLLSVGVVIYGKIAQDASVPSIDIATWMAIEIRNTTRSAELLAWKTFLDRLDRSHDRANFGRVGFIVDAHLGDIDAINMRRRPILDDYILPENVELIYASADAGAECVPNKMIRKADIEATRLLRAIAAESSLDPGPTSKSSYRQEFTRAWEFIHTIRQWSPLADVPILNGIIRSSASPPPFD
jgi:hypothetical protein